MNAVDTNILIYVHDSREPTKQAKAIDLITSLVDGVLLWQVACEYVAASRKLATLGYDRAKAWQDIRNLRKIWFTLLPIWSIHEKAEALSNRYNLSFWDAMIIAACLEGGVKSLYSEDFDAYSNIDDLEIINPFKV